MPLKTRVITLCKVYRGTCTPAWHHNGQPTDMHTLLPVCNQLAGCLQRSGLIPTYLLFC